MLSKAKKVTSQRMKRRSCRDSLLGVGWKWVSRIRKNYLFMKFYLVHTSNNNYRLKIIKLVHIKA